MGCPTEVEIGDNLVFSVVSHTPSTAAVTDADAVPAYRIYEDETGTAILTGNMAKLDDANTTGFYSESVACTVGNGFENGKTYTVYITAAVGSVTGGISYGFKAYDQRKADATKIDGDSPAAVRLKLSANQIIPGTVSTAVLTPTTTAFAADDITEATADHYNGRIIIFTSGALIGQATDISDYSLVSAEGNFTVSEMTEAPANNDTFIII